MNLQDLITPTEEPDYSHIARDCEATIELSQSESEVIFKTHDRGIRSLTDEQRKTIEYVLGKLKAEIHS